MPQLASGKGENQLSWVLAAGKHVLCEKPVALTLSDAIRIKEAAARSSGELRIGFMRRFDPAFDQLMKMHAIIGSPVLAQATIAAGIRPKLLMHDARANGGSIIDMCCHLFDTWAALFGSQAEVVSARGYTFGQDKAELAGIRNKAVDSAQLTLEYPGGAVGQVQVSWGLPRGIKPVEWHRYMGPDGLITVSWNERVTLHDGRGHTTWTENGIDPWREEIAQFHHELTAGASRQLATVDDGISALKTSLAALKAIRTKTAVRPDEVTDILEAPI